MSLDADSMLLWCRKLLGIQPRERLGLNDYLAAIGRLESLSDVPSGTPVLVRGDVDAKPGATVGEGDIRLRSMKETLEYGRSQGWKQIIFGHIGREPEKSLSKVAARLGEILGCDVPLIADWLDADSETVRDEVKTAIDAAAPGAVIVLENTRKYDIERVLWKAKEGDLPALAPRLAGFANSVAEKIATVYINEALSAGSLDASSTVVPAAMSRVALGKYIAGEFEGPMQPCLTAELVIFSGLKADKLDDLEAILARGAVKTIFVAGSLAMALKKAEAELAGGEFDLGVSEDPSHSDKPYFVPDSRIAQAKQLLTTCKEKGIKFVLPVDFTLEDGSVSDKIGPGNQQFDVGPETLKHFAKEIDEFIAAHPGAAVFYNGVFGMFEDPRFEAGTKGFIPELKRMKDAGLKVYVGGGEGGKALDRYGEPDWVTHCFTAGGTVLNALGSEPVPYLVALRMASRS